MRTATPEQACDIALTARRAMQNLRDSSLPGTLFHNVADDAVQAIDGVVAEARRMAEAGR